MVPVPPAARGETSRPHRASSIAPSISQPQGRVMFLPLSGQLTGKRGGPHVAISDQVNKIALTPRMTVRFPHSRKTKIQGSAKNGSMGNK